MARRSFKNLIQGASGAFGNAATRMETFVVKGGVYVYGSYPELDELFQQQAAELDLKKRENQLHDQRVRALLGRFRGREIDSAGDGFLAIFDGPARAVRCGLAIEEALRPLGLEVRVGVHTGEVELDGPAIRGVAVHTGARIMAQAGPGEVLVSSTVRDLVAGSGLDFEARGEHELKGIPGAWRLHAAVSPSPEPLGAEPL